MGTRSAGAAAATRHDPHGALTRRARRRPLLALFAVAALLASPALLANVTHPEPLANFPSAELTLDAHGAQHRFHVYLATTEARRNQGLMFVKSLPVHAGMLFLFDQPRVESFWMKNCVIPLDLLFIASDGRIIRIAENAVPGSEATISSMGRVLGVLELAGGAAARLGIRPGDRVHYPAFEPR